MGLVDLITKQRMTWQGKSWAEDGRAFETRALLPTDDPEFLDELKQARATLIEQVLCSETQHSSKSRLVNENKASVKSIIKFFNIFSSYFLQVADLDDEFAELVLGEHGDNFDSVPAGKVCYYTHFVVCI